MFKVIHVEFTQIKIIYLFFIIYIIDSKIQIISIGVNAVLVTLLNFQLLLMGK